MKAATAALQAMRTDRERRAIDARRVASTLLATAFASPAIAQIAPSSTPAASAEAPAIGDIVVTAQKRSESVQRVPIAITALNAAALAERGIVRPQDLQQNVPGLVFSDSATGVGLVTLRGVGGDATRGSTPGRNPAVPVHVDGVYLQSPAIMLEDFLDVDRVEVLRGPQGTLYGRNAIGGSINVITKRPTKDLEGEVGAEYGNYDKKRVYGVLSGPLIDRLRGRVAFAYQDHDGYVKNVDDPHDKLLASRYYNVRATLDYDLTDNLLASVTGYYYDKTGASYAFRPESVPPVNPFLPSLYNSVPAGYTPASVNDVRKVQQDTRGGGFDKTKGVTGNLQWNLGSISLRSITGYFDMNTGVTYDADGFDLPSTRGVGKFDSKYKTFSQELQVASDSTARLRWLLGGYYYHESSSYALLYDATTASVPFLIDYYTNPGEVRSRSLAAFGQLDFKATEKLTLTAGLRYTHDHMSVLRSGSFILLGTPLFDYTDIADAKGWSKVTWKFGANYQFTRDVMAYASYSRGYKSGGFNLQDTNPAFNPETLDAYEVGIKSQLLDRRLQLNASVYRYDYKNKQESTANATGFTVFENAGAATLTGAEFELLARVTTRFSVDGSVSYLHAKYDRYDSADPENLAAGVQSLAGNQLTDAPKWQAHAGAQYAQPLGDGRGTLTLRGDYSFTDHKYARAFNLPTDRLPSYSRSNAHLTWESDNHVWMAELYVDNIENKDVVNSFADTSAFQSYVHQNIYLPPRTYGGRLRYRF